MAKGFGGMPGNMQQLMKMAQKAQKDLQKGGFADTVGSYDPDPVPTNNPHGKILDHRGAAVTMADTGCLNHQFAFTLRLLDLYSGAARKFTPCLLLLPHLD